MSYPIHLYGNRHCRQTNPEAAKNSEMRKMFNCSVQINGSYNKNAHNFRLSFLFSILFALANSRFSVCCPCWLECKWTDFATAGTHDIWFTWYSVFFIFSFPIVVQFDVLCLQLSYNYSNLTKRNSPNQWNRPLS